MNKKILILNSSNQFWGAEVSLTILLKSLHPNEYKLVVRSDGSGFEAELAKIGVSHSSYDLELSPFKKNFFRSAFYLLKVMYQSKANIIYANNEDLSTLVAVVKVMTFFRVKTKVHIRTTPRKYDYYKKLMFVHNDIICNSRYTKNTLLDGINFYSKSKIHLVPNSHGQVEIEESKILDGTNRYFLTVGVIKEYKAQFDVAKVFNKANGDLAANYWLLGKNTEVNPYLRELEEYLEINELKEKVLIHPFKKNLGPVYSGAIATIIPSINETFGRVVIESGYYGTPVIVRNIEPLVELINHGENGLIWDGSEGHLLELLKRLSNDLAYRNLLGKNLKKTVINNYSDQNYYTKVKKIILGRA